MTSVDSIAALKALSLPADNVTVNALGYYNEGDYGGGLFYWDSTNSTTQNNWSIFQSNNSSTGRWIRVYDKKKLNIRWFGAKGDGVTDDAPIINYAVSVLSTTGGEIIFPKGNYKIATQVTVAKYVFFKGADYFPRQEFANGTTPVNEIPMFSITIGYGSQNTPAFLLKAYSGMSGFCFYYPEQNSSTSSTPKEYSYTLKADGTYVDDIFLTDLFFANPFNAISLNSAGRFNLQNIYGQPINIGIYINNVFDVARASHIHFWPFTYSHTSNMGHWILNNGTAFLINHIDGFSATDLFCFGYKYGFKLDGSCWGTFVSCNSDHCYTPIEINKVNTAEFVGGNFISNAIENPVIRTGTSVASDPIGTENIVKFKGCNFYGGQSVPVIISSSNGTFIFESCFFKYGVPFTNNGYRWMPLISESSAKVIIEGCKGFEGIIPAGDNNVTFNGVPLFAQDNNVTPTGFGNKDNWTISHASLVTTITGGFQIALTKQASEYVYSMFYTLPASMVQENGLYTLEFDYLLEILADSTNNNTFRFKLEFGRDISADINVRYGQNGLIPPTGKKIKVKLPFFLGSLTPHPTVCKIIWTTYNDISGNIKITNLQVHKQNRKKTSNNQIAIILRQIFLDPLNNGITHTIQGGRVVNYARDKPTAGTWSVGDKVYNVNPSSGGYIGWVCVGSPSDFRTFGRIS